jgi:hypothetical protein
MNSARADEPIRHGTPAIRSVGVSGTTVFAGDREHAVALAQFKAWLRARHPGAAVTVRCRWRPEEYGVVKVKITPLMPLPTELARGEIAPEPTRLLWIEQGLIAAVWRETVGWGH